MLKFYRPNFASGVIVLKEVVGEQTIYHRFTVKDQGKTFEYQNPSYMLAKYPHIFTVV
jgi:hypothetical protein